MDLLQAQNFLHENVSSINLRRHCYAVGAVMKALAKRFAEDTEIWEVAGLLHDADYEVTKDTPSEHTNKLMEWLKDIEVHEDIKSAILSHGWGYVPGSPEPKTRMQWSLYCCDELTGLIVAVALVKPERKLSSVTVESIMSKWRSTSFARGVNRDQIAKCEPMLKIPLPEFIEIAISSMQTVADDLGL